MSESGDKLRVCYVISTFYPFVGGGETHARLLCREMKKRGLDVFVITRRTSLDLLPEDTVEGVPVIRVSPTRTNRLSKYLMLFPVYFRLIGMREQYDVIVVSGLRLLGIPAMLAAQRLKKPCILRAASCGELSGGFIWDSPHLDGKPKARGLWQVLVRMRNRLLFKANGFLGISQAVGQEYRDCGIPDEKIRVINNGTDTDRFRPVEADEKRRLRKKLELPDKTLFAYSGKLNKGKGLLFLLRAWKSVCVARNDVHLVLIGSGQGSFLSCEDELKTRARDAGIEDNITFTGYVENVHEYLQAADVFIFPSENESLSNALIEALSCGLPCLASRVGGIPDTVRHHENGQLLPVRGDEAWVTAIEDLASDPKKRKQWAEAGRQGVLDRNSMEKVVDAHLDFFRQVVSGSGA